MVVLTLDISQSKYNTDHENNHSLNLWYLFIGEVDEYNEETHENKYLVFASTDKTKEVITKHTELWD